MADSAVVVTSGTGTNIDTRTEATNGHHRQVVVLGDPATNAGVAPVDATTGLKVDLGADNDVTVTGTVDLGATDNAVLDAIEADTTTIAGDTTTIAGDTTSIDAKIPALGQALAAGSVPVVLTASQLTTLTPPAAITGFATSAKQDTIIGHVDGIEGLLTTIDTDTGTIATEVAGLLTDTELRATPVPVSGTVTANLGATDNAVLDDIASDTEAIKTSLAGTLTVTGGGGGVEYTEGDTDATIVGSAIMFESNTGTNTISAVSNTTPLPISDAGGTLTVDGTVAVTNAGITTIAGAVSGTEMQVDVLTMPTTTVTATDLDIRNLTNTDVVTAELSAVDNAVLDTIAAKDFATQTTLSAINAKLVTGTDIGDVTINNASGASAVNIQDGGNTITVDGTVSANATLSAETTKVIGTVRVASGGIASGSIASGAIASGAIAAGAIAAGATSIATTEDTASAAADHLVKIAAIRRDTPVANDNTSNDGDYTQLKLDNFGKLWTSGSAPEDVAHVAGEALTIGGVRRIDTPATSAGTSGDWATMDASAEGALWATLTSTTTGGCTIFRSIDLDESEEEIKATAGNLYGYFAFNSAATTHYIKFYNATAANVTVGTTTPVLTLPIPAGAAANISFAYPIGFSTAICAAATTGIADNDTGAPAANSVTLNAFYK